MRLQLASMPFLTPCVRFFQYARQHHQTLRLIWEQFGRSVFSEFHVTAGGIGF